MNQIVCLPYRLGFSFLRFAVSRLARWVIAAVRIAKLCRDFCRQLKVRIPRGMKATHTFP